MKTVEYKVKICTGHSLFGKSWSKIYIKLVGEDGEGKRTRLHSAVSVFAGKETTHTVSCSKPLGKLVLIELEKMKQLLLPEMPWFVDKVEVTCPEGKFYTFPIYLWIRDEEIHFFREGKALVVGLDRSLVGKYSRDKELQERRNQYGWKEYAPGLPHSIDVDDIGQLPCEVQFSFTKLKQFVLTAAEGDTSPILSPQFGSGAKVAILFPHFKRRRDLFHVNMSTPALDASIVFVDLQE
uniref:Uncharacterized protein n=1 Tax=Knipowitschia caucasica TaxID=637954 RepID=A0AAV2LA07_KNICA